MSSDCVIEKISQFIQDIYKDSMDCILSLKNRKQLIQIEDQIKELSDAYQNVSKRRRMISNEVSFDFDSFNSNLKNIDEEWIRSETNSMVEMIHAVSPKLVTKDYKEYTFSNGTKKRISNALVMMYPECLLNVNFIDNDSRAIKKEIEIDLNFYYLDEILKYMNHDFDINELNGLNFDKFCKELMDMRIPFRSDILHRLYTGSNEYGIGWKNRCVKVNDNEYNNILDYMKPILSDLKFNKNTETLQIFSFKKEVIEYLSFNLQERKGRRKKIIKEATIKDCIQDFHAFLSSPSTFSKNELYNFTLLNQFKSLFKLDENNLSVHNYTAQYMSFFIPDSHILENDHYDRYLSEWLGTEYTWKTVYRASEHGYEGRSFHSHCDDILGPSLILIKTTKGYIFGGFTTQSWGDQHYIMDRCIFFVNALYL